MAKLHSATGTVGHSRDCWYEIMLEFLTEHGITHAAQLPPVPYSIPISCTDVPRALHTHESGRVSIHYCPLSVVVSCHHPWSFPALVMILGACRTAQCSGRLTPHHKDGFYGGCFDRLLGMKKWLGGSLIFRHKGRSIGDD